MLHGLWLLAASRCDRRKSQPGIFANFILTRLQEYVLLVIERVQLS